jgi:hypothetical protein
LRLSDKLSDFVPAERMTDLDNRGHAAGVSPDTYGGKVGMAPKRQLWQGREGTSPGPSRRLDGRCRTIDERPPWGYGL